MSDATELRRRIERALQVVPLLCAAGCTSTSGPNAEHHEDDWHLRTGGSCPSGSWCGPVDAAQALADPKNDAEPVLGCPTVLRGMPDDGRRDTGPYKGLSLDTTMHASLHEEATAVLHDFGKTGVCCYLWTEYCGGGRPLRHGDAVFVADVQPGEDWVDSTLKVEIANLPRALRETIARAWLDDARAEHASIASFARASLELLAVGAPPELVAGCQQASLDEIRHARSCFALAAAYGGTALRPGGLPIAPPRGTDLVALACNTFVEGCVGETIAALIAARASREAADPRVRRVLAGIRDDESEHASLAWQTIGWSLSQGGPAVAHGLAATAARLRGREHPDASAAPKNIGTGTQLLLAHGRLDDATQRQVHRDAWREIIDPLLQSTLARAQGATTSRSSVLRATLAGGEAAG
jgi:hypothetical protein